MAEEGAGSGVWFHVGDVLTLATYIAVSFTECTPKDEAGHCLDKRGSQDEALCQLIECLTGVEVERRANPRTGVLQICHRDMHDLYPVAREALLMQYPQLANIDPPDFSHLTDQKELDTAIRVWVQGKIDEGYGEWFLVEPPEEKHRAAIEVEERKGPSKPHFPRPSMN